MGSLKSAKIVIRCRDFSLSRQFYSSVLGLRIVAEWEESGGKGCIFAVTRGEDGGYLEIYEMTNEDERYHPSFSARLQTDKIDLQLRTDSVDSWVNALQGAWPFDGPERLPWGQRWIKLRDPDDLLIAIYEGEV
ncbi:MAG: VOC family protein [Bacteroidota bacterium]